MTSLRAAAPLRKTFLTFLFVFLAISTASAQPPAVMMPDSTNNRIVLFDPFNGSVVNSNYFPLPASTTPIHAMQVNNEIWVSMQVGDRVERYSLTGSFLGQIGGGPSGGLDNIRGMGLINNTVYVTNGGAANGSPGSNAVVMFNTSGGSLGSFLASGSSSPFGVFSHQGNMLVSSSSANDDIHRYTLAGASLGTFHNTTALNFAEQMTLAVNGDILTAGFSTNNVVRLDPNTGALLSSFAASGARGVYQLGNGNILWSSGAGVSVFDVGLGTSSSVYTGGGRYLDLVNFTSVPEPTSLLLAGMTVGSLGLAYRYRRPLKRLVRPRSLR